MRRPRHFQVLTTILALFLVAVSLSAADPGLLSFEDRVRAQEAIERVYYEHRIWPKDNPQPKPPFEEAVPHEVLEAKVVDALRKNAALGIYWNSSITQVQLHRELERINLHSQDAQALDDLFTALDNDSIKILECLIRPILADRYIRDYFHSDSRQVTLCKISNDFTEWWDSVKHDIPLNLPSSEIEIQSEPALNDKASIEYSCSGAWQASILNGIPDNKVGHTTVWTGAEIIVWGGSASNLIDAVNRGIRYYPATDSVSYTSTGTNCPSPRSYHEAVWTGLEMIIVGGGTMHNLTDGGKYNPATDSWVSFQIDFPCIGCAWFATAVWSGNEMLLWGGTEVKGCRFNPTTYTWRPMALDSQAPSARSSHSAIWTGTEMIIWGGSSGSRYNPSTDTWVALPITAQTPQVWYGHTAVWTGSEMIVWGGEVSAAPQVVNTGARYNLLSNQWFLTTTTGACPTARRMHSAAWNGKEMVIWGGWGTYLPAFKTGSRYDPARDAWFCMPTEGLCPTERYGPSAVWTGKSIVIIGGEVYAGIGAMAGGVFSDSCFLDCSATAIPTQGQAPLSVSFTSYSNPSGCAGTPTYSWSFGDGGDSQTQNTSHVYANPGTYTWSFTANVSGVNCVKSGSITVEASENPPQVSSVSHTTNPFRVIILGSNFQNGIAVFLANQGTPWPNILYRNSTKLVIKKASALFPNNSTWVNIRIVNTDGGEITVEYNRTLKAWRYGR